MATPPPLERLGNWSMSLNKHIHALGRGAKCAECGSSVWVGLLVAHNTVWWYCKHGNHAHPNNDHHSFHDAARTWIPTPQEPMFSNIDAGLDSEPT